MIRIYIADLAAYNDGELVGAWIDPLNDAEVDEAIARFSHNGQSDWAIHDFEAPFRIDEHDDVREVADWARTLEEALETYPPEVIEAVFDVLDRDDGLNALKEDAVIVYEDCDTMTDVAHAEIEDMGLMRELPELVQSYFDFDAFGRDLAIDGTYSFGRHPNGAGFAVRIIS